MGVLYFVNPLDDKIIDYLRDIGVALPENEELGRNPTPSEIRSVCGELTDLRVTFYSPPTHHWQVKIEGANDPETEPWTLLNISNFNGCEDIPHSIWFEKGWPSLILRIVHKLSGLTGPLVIFPDTGESPIVVSMNQTTQTLLETWEHTRDVGR